MILDKTSKIWIKNIECRKDLGVRMKDIVRIWVWNIYEGKNKINNVNKVERLIREILIKK